MLRNNDKKPTTLPSQLTDKSRFILWRLGDINPATGRKRKIPYNAQGKPCNALDPINHLSYKQAIKELNTSNFDGIGFALNGDSICCLDIDNASQLNGQVPSLLNAFSGTWCEQSQSGDGYHCFFIGKPTKTPFDHAHFQLYTDNQFIALTGIQQGTASQIVKIDFDTAFNLPFNSSAQPETMPTTTEQKHMLNTLSDDDILKKALKAKNGKDIKRLYDSSQNSEDDLSLTAKLAFYTHSSVGGGTSQLMRIILAAPCHDSIKSRHPNSTSKYIERTINKAAKNSTRTYTPRKTNATKNSAKNNATNSTANDTIANSIANNYGSKGQLGFQMLPDGLHFFIFKDNKTIDERITYAPFEIFANTRDENNQNWGKLLRWLDPDGEQQEFLMPNESLAADGKEYREILFSLGLMIKPKNKGLMTDYILSYEPDKKLYSARKTGWNKGAYVFPNETIGGTDVIMQSQMTLKKEFEKAGSIEEWRKHVADKCEGNSRLMFSASLAFASMLLPFTNEESGGVQITGGSSTGKTTAAYVAASIYGNPRAYVKQWRNTSNALEAVALARNDALLILDELSQVEPRDAGETIYMLANGSGKGRMTRSAQLREPKTWRLLFLSTGEISLSEHMKTAGKKTRAGQETRIVDLPADTSIHGAFENIHSEENGASFSDMVKLNCSKYHGVPARLMAQYITEQDPDKIAIEASNIIKATTTFLLPDGKIDGQVRRVARRFAVISLGGVYAIKAGIVTWDCDDLYQSIKTCFDAWLNQRGGTGSIEEREILKQVNYFFERYANSRFITHNQEDKPPHDMAGLMEAEGEHDTHFYVLPEVFNNQICEGYKPKAVIDVCVKNGLLILGKDKTQTPKRIPNIGLKRVYHFKLGELTDKK